MTEVKVGQIWRRKADGTLVEVRRIHGAVASGYQDINYRRVGIKGVGTSACYLNAFVKRYELVHEVA